MTERHGDGTHDGEVAQSTSGIFRRFHEWMSAKIFGDDSSHPSGTSKVERWRNYPYEPEKHADHDTAQTRASYGKYRVYYCYTCSDHYRSVDTGTNRSEASK